MGLSLCVPPEPAWRNGRRMQAQPGVSVAGPACRGPVSTRAFVLSGACSLNTLRTGHGARQCAWPLGQSIARRHLVAVCEKRVPASLAQPSRLKSTLHSLSGLSVPNVHGALAPLAIPSAAAAAAAGRIAIPGLAGAGNSVLLVSNLNPEVCGCCLLCLYLE